MLTVIVCWLVVVGLIVAHGVHAQKPSSGRRRARTVFCWAFVGALAGAAIGFAVWRGPSGMALIGALLAAAAAATLLRK